MSVSTTTKSDWIDGNNDVIVSATPVRVRAVEVQGRTDGTADAWVRLYNSANATPGTTEPTLVVYIPRSQTKDGKVRQKVIFGGVRFDTGLTMGVYTTPHSGSTSSASADAPYSVKIHYEPSA